MCGELKQYSGLVAKSDGCDPSVEIKISAYFQDVAFDDMPAFGAIQSRARAPLPVPR